jgi:Leucine-rich repeat (LRR) protein
MRLLCADLDASSNDIGKKCVGMPAPGSLALPALEGLNLANNNLGPQIPQGAMDWCPSVRAASFNNNDIVSFVDSPPWAQLQYLNLANNDLRLVPSLSRSPYLRQLYLESNNLRDDQVPHPYSCIAVYGQ